MRDQAVKPSAPEEKIQVGVSNALVKAAQAGFPVVSISSDLAGSTGVAGFRKAFPQLSFDVGVAEANMISSAAGFSKNGYIPVVDTFAQFGVTKGALPLTMASLSDAPMICIFSHSGFQDAADGASHQALSYLAMVSSIPHVHTYCLTCSEEAESLIYQTVEKFVEDRQAGRQVVTSIFFLGRENFPQSYLPQQKYSLQKAQILRETPGNRPVVILASGSMAPEALRAADELASTGAIVINPGIHNKLDVPTVKEALTKAEGRLVIVEDHQRMGGFAQMASFELARAGVTFKLKSLAVAGEFGQSAYTAQELYRHHRIDAAAIVAAAREL